MVGNAADEADGQVCSLILSDIAAEEVAEAADDHLAQFGHVEMLMDKGRKRGQETVGHRLAVNAADDVGHLEPRLLLKSLAQSYGQQSFVKRIEQMAAQYGSAALIAQDVAQRRRVLHYLTAVVEARVGSRAYDAGNALGAPADGSCSPKEVAVSLDCGLGKHLLQQTGHERLEFGPYAAAVEMEPGNGSREARQLRQQFYAEDGQNVVLRLVKWIDALRLQACPDVGTVGQHPVGLGAAAVSNEFHGHKSTQIKLKIGILL